MDENPETCPVQVAARRHVLDDDLVRLTLAPGVNLVDVLEQAGVNPVLGPWLAVAVDGMLVERHHWLATEPPAGSFVTVAIVPRGGDGGGNKIIRIVALVAIAAAVAFTGVVLAPALGFAAGSFGAAALSAAVGIGLTLAVNALIPPPRPTTRSSDRGAADIARSPTISGAGNELPKFGDVIPTIFGRHRIFPPTGRRRAR